MKNIIDYYYESTQTITIRIICDNCKICKDNNNEYWSIGNSPKTYISYEMLKRSQVDDREIMLEWLLDYIKKVQ